MIRLEKARGSAKTKFGVEGHPGGTMPPDPAPASASEYHPEDARLIELPRDFYGLLEAIRRRPALYLGHRSLVAFRSWLDGYHYAKSEAGVGRSAEEEEFADFDSFVCRKYRWHDVGGWAAKIAYYHRDDGTALDKFFELLDEFRAGRTGRRKGRGKRPPEE
jgi:hypothetical protein